MERLRRLCQTSYAKSATTPTTPVALEAAWRGTTEAKESARGLETTTKSSDEWPEAFQKRFELGFGTYAKWCFKRRLQEIKGDPSYYKARMCQSIFMGFFTGSLYWQTSYMKSGQNKLGLFFVGLMYVGLGAIAQAASSSGRTGSRTCSSWWGSSCSSGSPRSTRSSASTTRRARGPLHKTHLFTRTPQTSAPA